MESVLDIPEEVLVYILQLLDVESLLQVSLVNKRLHHLIENDRIVQKKFWYKFDVDNFSEMSEKIVKIKNKKHPMNLSILCHAPKPYYDPHDNYFQLELYFVKEFLENFIGLNFDTLHLDYIENAVNRYYSEIFDSFFMKVRARLKNLIISKSTVLTLSEDYSRKIFLMDRNFDENEIRTLSSIQSYLRTEKVIYNNMTRPFLTATDVDMLVNFESYPPPNINSEEIFQLIPNVKTIQLPHPRFQPPESQALIYLAHNNKQLEDIFYITNFYQVPTYMPFMFPHLTTVRVDFPFDRVKTKVTLVKWMRSFINFILNIKTLETFIFFNLTNIRTIIFGYDELTQLMCNTNLEFIDFDINTRIYLIVKVIQNSRCNKNLKSIKFDGKTYDIPTQPLCNSPQHNENVVEYIETMFKTKSKKILYGKRSCKKSLKRLK